MKTLPILYSFRRCPYAMRARLAIKISEVEVELREVVLKDKPKQMLDYSPKGTVPVLQLDDGTVIDESRDIMEWALAINDPQSWLLSSDMDVEEINRLIALNDNTFKEHLDHYKYADRFPEDSEEYYRKQGEVFLQELEARLSNSQYLMNDKLSLLDIAVFPFIRQFAYVDINWFEQSKYKKLNIWLTSLIGSDLFKSIMKKYPKWSNNCDALNVL
jgi:glutathione S-transferase